MDYEERRARDQSKLRSIIAFCQTAQCRTRYILEYFGEEAGPFLRVAFWFPDHERRPRGLRQMAGSKVRSPPLHRPDDEVLVSDDRSYAVLHEPVA